jgi:DNA-binding HxlR family transcriptional regulator
MTTLSTTDVQRAQAVLSSPALIRLVTEIDDNGPIPPRALARTLADVPEDHLRHRADQARVLGLVHVHPGAGLSLTTAGEELADVYDALARWARRHSYPAPVCDFTGRVQHTLAFLAQLPVRPSHGGSRRRADAVPASLEAGADVAWLRRLLEEWLHDHPQVVGVADPEIVALGPAPPGIPADPPRPWCAASTCPVAPTVPRSPWPPTAFRSSWWRRRGRRR